MTDGNMDEVPLPRPKLDPESLVLRASPARVTRFRRGAIIAIAAVGSSAIAGISLLALRPPHFHALPTNDDAVQLPAKPPSDALQGAPRDYGDVPKLGPPLPGDLGPPILAHEREIEARPDNVQPDEAGQAVAAALERRESERRSAMQSGIMVELGSASRSSEAPIAPAAVPATPATSSSSTDRVSLDLEHDPNGQQRKLDFVAKRDGSGSLNPHAIEPSPSPYTLAAGSVISASLLTGLNSDLPGMVTAQVTHAAYDSATGHILLIPQGARLIGDYDNVVAFGQSRALVVWKRIVFPDGSSIDIENMPASDPQGYAGLSDRVDRHSWELMKGIALSTLLGVGSELSLNNGSDGNLAQALAESAELSGARAGDQLVSHNLDVQPTLKVRPGYPVRVLVQKDLVLRPWQNSGG